MRTPTPKQYERLRVLAIGTAGMSWSKRIVEPLLSHGWVTAEPGERYYQWVQITPDGLRALALAVERYGLPEFKREEATSTRRVCAECGSGRYRSVCSGCGSRHYRFEEVAAEALGRAA